MTTYYSEGVFGVVSFETDPHHDINADAEFWSPDVVLLITDSGRQHTCQSDNHDPSPFVLAPRGMSREGRGEAGVRCAGPVS